MFSTDDHAFFVPGQNLANIRPSVNGTEMCRSRKSYRLMLKGALIPMVPFYSTQVTPVTEYDAIGQE
jgi:hypothetical protein